MLANKCSKKKINLSSLATGDDGWHESIWVDIFLNTFKISSPTFTTHSNTKILTVRTFDSKSTLATIIINPLKSGRNDKGRCRLSEITKILMLPFHSGHRSDVHKL